MKLLVLPRYFGPKANACFFYKWLFVNIKLKSSGLAISCFFFCIISIAQKSNRSLEINPFFRLDWYPKFSYNTGGITRDNITMKGTSWGTNLAYKIPLKNNFSVKVGIGYYRYTFNKIIHFNTTFGNGNKRTIFYPSSYYLLYATDRYWYNTISINVSSEKHLKIEDQIEIIIGLNLSNHITYSQYYHIPVDYPVGPQDGRYTRMGVRFFGLDCNGYFSILKKIGRVQAGPSFIIPIFDTWKQDKIFPEEKDSSARGKWLRGFGMGLILSIPLTFNN